MSSHRLVRLRYWPGTIYSEQLTRLWEQNHPRDRAASLPLPTDALETGSALARPRRVALVVHVYYVDLLDEVIDVITRLPVGADVYVSVVREYDVETVDRRLFESVSGRLLIRLVENRGRDIAPKYVAFRDVYEMQYDLLLFLHTKKSTLRDVGEPWRVYLYASLAGSRDRVGQVLALFDREPRLGVVAPEHFAGVAEFTTWYGNYAHAIRLARRMALPLRRWSPPDFPAGSMFWARPEALRPLTELQLQQSEFPPEAKQVAHTIMHALERLVFLAAKQAGFTYGFVPGVEAGSEGRGVALSTGAGAAASAGSDGSAAVPSIGLRLHALWATGVQMSADIGIRIRKVSYRNMRRKLAER